MSPEEEHQQPPKECIITFNSLVEVMEIKIQVSESLWILRITEILIMGVK